MMQKPEFKTYFDLLLIFWGFLWFVFDSIEIFLIFNLVLIKIGHVFIKLRS